MFRSTLEHLPDEILIEICLYLSAIDAIKAFEQINARLDRTIHQFRSDINLQYVTLQHFQQFTQDYLPFHAEYIVKLTFNTWYSPGQIFLFNQSISQYQSLRDFLPSLKQIWLINFGNKDVEILSKILSIEKVMIDVDTQILLLDSTKKLLDHYFFSTPNTVKELRLYGTEDGLTFQHHIPVRICENLEQLIISVTTLDDLILIFRRAPYLKKLHVEVNVFCPGRPKQYATVEIMPKLIKDFHLWVKDKRLLLFDDLYNILINMPTIERLSLEIETDDIQYSQGDRWKELISNLPNLSRLDMGLKISIGRESTPIDVIPYLETFRGSLFDVCCYADSRILFIDTIPYVYDSTTGVMTSPRASQAQATNMKVLQQRARRVNTLCFDGRHESSSINDWFTVIRRFPRIQVLDIVSINISDKVDGTFRERNEHLRLPNLTILRYIRSTKCQVNLSVFMYLVDNEIVAPRLRTLTIMYGDLIYLCKRLPKGVCFPRVRELCVYANGADGRICLKGVDLILTFFPNLEHFWLHVQSSRLINRQAEMIVKKFFYLLSNLTSFRLSCKKDSLRLPMFNDSNARLRWIYDVCRLGDPNRIHITVGKKELALWK